MLTKFHRTCEVNDKEAFTVSLESDLTDVNQLRYYCVLWNTHVELATLDAKYLSGKLAPSEYNDQVSALKSRCAKLMASIETPPGS